MKLFAKLLPFVFVFAASAADDYQLGPDSKPQDGVPKGEIIKFTFDKSKIFPGTTREVSVYVPQQYDPANPACLYVNQDGVQWNAPVVFDNLIHKKEMPVTIGVFATPGVVKSSTPTNALDRFNRSYEYDGLGDSYARFLIEELLPEVESRKTSDGRAILFSKSPNDHAIGGSSSGAIAAFTAAWERPDAFRRVFSCIGTYVGLRGGERYPTLIRKFEPRPLRVFLQDGSNDLNKYGGDWWMANQTMERALSFAGYEVNHAWGDGGHSGKQGSAIFSDAMRWLWKDWPQPVQTHTTGNETMNALLIPGEDWKIAVQSCTFSDGPAANDSGEVFFNDRSTGRMKAGRVAFQIAFEYTGGSKLASGQAFGPDGRLYVVEPRENKIVAYTVDNKSTVIADGIAGNDIVVAHNGNIYVTDPSASRANLPSKVWLIKPGGEKQEVDIGLRVANGITLSPDQSLLYVDDSRSHWVYSYQIQPDGTLKYRQRFYWLHCRDDADDSGADGMRVDREGRLYVATRMGIQVSDQAGKVQCIIPTPNGKSSNLCFGGEHFDILYVTAGDKIFKRKLKVQGANAWDVPNKPPVPRL